MRDMTQYAVHVWYEGKHDYIIVCGNDNSSKALGMFRKIYGEELQYEIVHMETGEMIATNIPQGEQ